MIDIYQIPGGMEKMDQEQLIIISSAKMRAPDKPGIRE